MSMHFISSLAIALLAAVLVSTTIAICARLLSWGLTEWLLYRLDVRASKVQQLESEVKRMGPTAPGSDVTLQAPQPQPRLQSAHIERQDRGAVSAPGHSAPLLFTDRQPVEPDLPDLVRWRDVTGCIKPGYFAYGILAGGKLVQRPVTTAYHTLLHGETRSGKTAAIHNLITQAHQLALITPVHLYMTDVKRELSAAWGRSPLLAATIQNDAAVAADMIRELVHGPEGVLARYASFEALARRHGMICASLRDFERRHPDGRRARPPLVFVVIDELNALLELARKTETLQSALTTLLQTGAAAGFYVIAGAQYLNARVLGRDATQQFVSRAHFGAYDPVALRMLFSHAPPPAPASTLPPGRGFIRVCGQTAAQPFQGLFCDEETILEVQRGAGPRVTLRKHGERRQQAPGAQQERLAETPETVHVTETHWEGMERVSSVSDRGEIDSGKALRVAQLVAGNQGKRAIIAEVWGATTGRRYMAASAEYEAIIARLPPSHRSPPVA